MRHLQRHQNPALGKSELHVEITASTRGAEEPAGSSPCKNFCSSCWEFPVLGCLLIPLLPLHRAAGGLWEKVPVTAAAPAVPGFLSQGPHSMNKNTCLTRKEKKKIQKICFTCIYHMLLTASQTRGTQLGWFFMFLGVLVQRTTELHIYTCSNPCSLVLFHPRSQAGTGRCNHCQALPSSPDSPRLQSSSTAPPQQGKDLPLLSRPALCSQQPQNCSV